MTEQTSRLAVIIDSSGAQKNADSLTTSLSKLTQAGEKAETATENLSSATKDYNSWMKQGPKLADEYTKSTQAATKATNDEAKALGALLDKINPINAALNRLDDQQQALSKFKRKGMLDEETFTQYNAKLEQAREKLTGFSEALTKTGDTSRHAAHNLAMIPSQLSWMITSIASGQSPIMALVQQGSMLSGMMGGVGPAIRGVGTYLIGLVNPLTVAGAAVGVFGAALYAAEKQASALNIAANSLTNISGMNLTQITALAQGTTALGVSYGDAVTSVSSLSQALSTNADLYPQIIKASSEYSEASGQDLSTVISLFTQLSDSSGKAIDALDDKLGFLTAAQRKQADEALRSGNITDAQRIAFESLSSRLETLTKQLNLGATGWDKFWHSVDRGASNTWEGFKEVVGGNYFDNRDVERYQQRTAQRSSAMSTGTWTGNDEQHYQMLNDTPVIRAYVKATSDLDAATKEAAGNAYLKSLNKDLNANADAVTKAKTALVALDDQYKEQPADIQKQGHSDYLARRLELQKNLSDAEAAAARKNQPPKQHQGRAYTEDAGSRLVSQINQQTASMYAQLNASDKLSVAAQERAKFEQQIADIQVRIAKNLPITNDQKSLLNSQKEVEQAYDRYEISVKNNTTLDDYRKMMLEIAPKEQKQNDILQKRLELLQKMVALKKLSPEDASKQASDLISKSVLPDSVISGVNAAGGTLKSGATNSDLSGQGMNMIGLQSNPQLETIAKLRKAQTDYASWLNSQEKAINSASFANEQDRQKALMDVQSKGAANQQAISLALHKTEMESAQTSFSSITDSMGTMFGQQSGMYKAAFATQKAFAIAQAGIQLPMAMAQAMANLPFPANLAAVANVVALMSTITSSITSVAANGFQSGGYTGNGGVSDVAGVVHGQEFVMDAAATKRIGVSNLEAIRRNGLDATLSRSGFGTGAKNVSNNQSNVTHLTVQAPPITINGNPSDSTIQLVQQAAKQGAQQGYKMVAGDLAAGKGQVHKSLTAGYNTSRRTG